MVSVAKREERQEGEPMKALHFDAPQRDVDLADELCAKRLKRTSARPSRNNMLREALHRGLLSLAEEEGVKHRR